jgi:hypothetical protein
MLDDEFIYAACVTETCEASVSAHIGVGCIVHRRKLPVLNFKKTYFRASTKKRSEFTVMWALHWKSPCSSLRTYCVIFSLGKNC